MVDCSLHEHMQERGSNPYVTGLDNGMHPVRFVPHYLQHIDSRPVNVDSLRIDNSGRSVIYTFHHNSETLIVIIA